MTEISRTKENALRVAEKNGRIDDVKALIESGVNPHAVDRVCVVCLFTVCVCVHVLIVTFRRVFGVFGLNYN